MHIFKLQLFKYFLPFQFKFQINLHGMWPIHLRFYYMNGKGIFPKFFILLDFLYWRFDKPTTVPPWYFSKTMIILWNTSLHWWQMDFKGTLMLHNTILQVMPKQKGKKCLKSNSITYSSLVHWARLISTQPAQGYHYGNMQNLNSRLAVS